jgi:hypothetical protein
MTHNITISVLGHIVPVGSFSTAAMTERVEFMDFTWSAFSGWRSQRII